MKELSKKELAAFFVKMTQDRKRPGKMVEGKIL
jgi:hypothetical protein